MQAPNKLKTEKTPHEYRTKIEDEELELIKRSKVHKILEVCAGDGRNVVFFAKKGYDIKGLESEDKQVEKGKELIQKEKVAAEIRKHPIFTQDFPFKDEEFDMVYSYQYLNHNFKDRIEEVFKEMHRVLRKGGILSLKITDIEQLNVRHIEGDIYQEQDPEYPKMNYRKIADQTFVKLEGDEKGIPHYGFTEQELRNSLEKTGFKILNTRKIRWNIVANATK